MLKYYLFAFYVEQVAVLSAPAICSMFKSLRPYIIQWYLHELYMPRLTHSILKKIQAGINPGTILFTLHSEFSELRILYASLTKQMSFDRITVQKTPIALIR